MSKQNQDKKTSASIVMTTNEKNTLKRAGGTTHVVRRVISFIQKIEKKGYNAEDASYYIHKTADDLEDKNKE